MAMVDPNTKLCESLTHWNGVRVVCMANVEVCVLTIGNVVWLKNNPNVKCFKCGKTDYLVWACPKRQSEPSVSERHSERPAVVDPPVATVQPAAEGPRSCCCTRTVSKSSKSI